MGRTCGNYMTKIDCNICRFMYVISICFRFRSTAGGRLDDNSVAAFRWLSKWQPFRHRTIPARNQTKGYNCDDSFSFEHFRFLHDKRWRSTGKFRTNGSIGRPSLDPSKYQRVWWKWKINNTHGPRIWCTKYWFSFDVRNLDPRQFSQSDHHVR